MSPHPQPNAQFLVARINAKLQPMHRGEFFENPLNAALKLHGRCEVSGGGTMGGPSGEIQYCDVEITGSELGEQDVSLVVSTLEQLGAPKGSKLTIESTSQEIQFGRAEGLAVYLNGTDLPDETYRDCDSKHVLAEFDRLLEGEGRVLSYWQGPRETAFYMYGRSFDAMKSLLSGFVASYPLCARCRVERVA
jgi:hypothetical protein